MSHPIWYNLKVKIVGIKTGCYSLMRRKPQANINLNKATMEKDAKSNHRQRLKDRFIAAEAQALSDAALLELLLTYGIPQKDVRPLAEELISHFGSLSGVLQADVAALCHFDGIKGHAAVLMKLVDHISVKTHAAQSKKSKKTKEIPAQATLFDHVGEADSVSEPIEEKREIPETEVITTPQSIKRTKTPAVAPKKTAPRPRTAIFTNAVLKDAIEQLPDLPDTENIEEIRSYLSSSLHYSAESTRRRFAGYIITRMFPDGVADAALRRFSAAFPNSRELREACFYRFMKAEPLVENVVSDLIIPALGVGQLPRQRISEYIKKRFPDSSSIDKCSQACAQALNAGGVAKGDLKKLVFSYRDIPVASLAFVLHSEFPEPGMYNIEELERNGTVKAMLWHPDRLLPALYELRNMRLLPKISEIDSFRQFTTKYTLPEAVGRIIEVSAK